MTKRRGGNKGAGSKDVAPMIRGAFKRAVLMLEDEGKPLSTLVKESLEDNFRDTLRAISSFTPKELEITEMPAKLGDMNEEQLDQLGSLAASILSEDGEGEASEGAGQLNRVH